MKEGRKCRRASFTRLFIVAMIAVLALALIYPVATANMARAAWVEAPSLDREGMFDNPYTSLEEALEVARAKHEEVVNEGTALLKNNGLLPLSSTQTGSNKVTVFNSAPALVEGLEGVGFEVNDISPQTSTSLGQEGSGNQGVITQLNADQLKSIDKYNDVAVVRIFRTAGEANDVSTGRSLTSGLENFGDITWIDEDGKIVDKADWSQADYEAGKYREAWPDGTPKGWNHENLTPNQPKATYTDVANPDKRDTSPVRHGLMMTANEENTYTVRVRVENTGNVPAKDVVQVYVNTPYGEYEKQRNIEKSAILFVGFAKTGVVEPGAANAVTVDVVVEEYLFASYDYTDTKGYVLTEGDYTFAVGRDAHDALNNVLGNHVHASGLVDQDGNAVTADADTTYTWHMDLDTTTYMYGEGEADERIRVTNRFDKMDINYWEGNDVTYLTRSDWQNTFPTEPAEAYLLGEEMETLLQGDFYRKADDAPSTSIYAQGVQNNWQGVDNELPFVSMRNVAYDNDEVWESFIDQFSLDDLVLMTGNYFGNNAIGDPVNLPEKGGGDGCQGVGDEAYDTSLTGGKVLWPCLYTSLLACTYNKEIMEERGTLMANQALFLDQTVIWTGGGNLHRTPYGGRNAEYYSEDANLCYMVGSIELPAMERLGILGGIKHFAANDQESNREGVSTFYTEQAFREGALRGFEGAIRKGKVNAVMQAFNRQGVVYSSSCYELNVTVLREEWGFKGEAITDASSGITTGYKSHYTTSMANGTDIYCLDGESVGGGIIAKYIKDNDDGYLLGWLRTAARHTAYALSRSAAVNGLDDNTVIRDVIPVWQIMTVVGTCVVGVLAAGAIVLCVLSKRRPSAAKAGE